ncbi:P-loop containing nucleoside triphosphate hydrolase protein, partial [Marasmius fiardii PR-910]
LSVMGTTGSGKSTFINLASGGSLAIGSGLKSCTSTIQLSPSFLLDGRQVVLIDTPGFDDTNVSDADILELIAAFLASTYQNGKKLAGVIYIHRISDFRMGGISIRNFKMFRKLCGESTLKNVLIVTNMWGEVSQKIGEARELELKSDDMFFKPVLDKKARLVRHDNTPDTAHAILSLLVQNEPLPLCIQTELVDEGLNSIADTAAGGELGRELKKQTQRHIEEMAKLEAEMKEAIEAKDEETHQALEKAKERLEKHMNEAKEDVLKLSLAFAGRIEELVKKMEEERRVAEKEAEKQREEISNLKNMLENQAQLSAAEREELQRKLDEAIQRYKSQPGGWCNIM